MNHLGRYRLDRTLGAGAFATVWLGYDPELDAAVAIKVLAENWALDADVRARFLEEARLLRRISDPRVVRVHDIGVAGDRPYFVMDHVDGGTLADVVGTLAPAEAVRLAIEVAYAVDVLHREGVIHRDVKPSNLLLDRRTDPPAVLVADLGSAKPLAAASGLTVTTGTPAYMAPEQADQLGGFDGRADVYAVAAVTYELLSGQRPFDDSSPASVARRAPGVRPAPIATRLGLPARLDDLLARSLDRDPERRPPSAAAFAEALTAVVGGGRAALPPVAREWSPRLVAGVAVLLFLVAALAGWLLH